MIIYDRTLATRGESEDDRAKAAMDACVRIARRHRTEAQVAYIEAWRGDEGLIEMAKYEAAVECCEAVMRALRGE